MPRYFITTADGFVAHDDEGVELPDVDALEKLLCRTLADILRDEGCKKDRHSFMAYAADEAGKIVVTATISVGMTRA